MGANTNPSGTVRWKPSGILSLNRYCTVTVEDGEITLRPVDVPRIQVGATVVGLGVAVLLWNPLSPLVVLAATYLGRFVERVYADETAGLAPAVGRSVAIRPEDVVDVRRRRKLSFDDEERGVLVVTTTDTVHRLYGTSGRLSELEARLLSEAFEGERAYCVDCGAAVDPGTERCGECGEYGVSTGAR